MLIGLVVQTSNIWTQMWTHVDHHGALTWQDSMMGFCLLPGSAVAYSAYVFPEEWLGSTFHQNYVSVAVLNTVISTTLSCYSRYCCLPSWDVHVTLTGKLQYIITYRQNDCLPGAKPNKDYIMWGTGILMKDGQVCHVTRERIHVLVPGSACRLKLKEVLANLAGCRAICKARGCK